MTADCSVMSNGVPADCSVMSNGVTADCRAERVKEIEQVERDQRGQSALRPSLYSEGVRGVRRERPVLYSQTDGVSNIFSLSLLNTNK